MIERIVDGPENLFISGAFTHVHEILSIQKLITKEAGAGGERWWPNVPMPMVAASTHSAFSPALKQLKHDYEPSLAKDIYANAENLLVVGNRTPLTVKRPVLELIGAGIEREDIEKVYYLGSEKSIGSVAMLGLTKLEIVDHVLDMYTYESQSSEAMK